VALPLEHLREYGGEKTVARTFSMRTTAEPLSLLARARSVTKENGATLVGASSRGASRTIWSGASTVWRGKR
jgi:hypothetical protein